MSPYVPRLEYRCSIQQLLALLGSLGTAIRHYPQLPLLVTVRIIKSSKYQIDNIYMAKTRASFFFFSAVRYFNPSVCTPNGHNQQFVSASVQETLVDFVLTSTDIWGVWVDDSNTTIVKYINYEQ